MALCGTRPAPPLGTLPVPGRTAALAPLAAAGSGFARLRLSRRGALGSGGGAASGAGVSAAGVPSAVACTGGVGSAGGVSAAALA